MPPKESNEMRADADEDADNSFEEVEEVEETEDVEEDEDEVEYEEVEEEQDDEGAEGAGESPTSDDREQQGSVEQGKEATESPVKDAKQQILAADAVPTESVKAGEPEFETAGSPKPELKEDSSPPPYKAAGSDMDIKAIEAHAAKVAQDVQNAAVKMSNKLSAGFMSALENLGSATEASSLNKVAGGLASWWGSLDPPSLPKRNEMQERVQASSKPTSELQDLFGLSAEENLVETFKCKLIQTYACSHNSFTPAIQMAFQGTLHITDAHTCFSVEERNRKVPFKVLHSQITKAVRQRPLRKGDLSDILRLDLSPGGAVGGQQFLAFKDFESGSALDSALALVEHLMEG